MATRPQGAGLIGDISDDDLDAAIDDAFDSDDETSTTDDALTVAPEPADAGPSSDDTPAPASSDTAPAGDAPTAPSETAHPAPEAASASPAPVGKPFQFKASGGVHTLPGALELPDGSVVIPKESQADFRRELAHGRELQANFKQVQRKYAQEIQQAKTQRTEKDAEADAVIGLMSDLLKLPFEQQVQYLSEFQGNVPRLQLDLERKQLDEKKKLFEQQQKGPQLSEEEQQEQFSGMVQQEFATTWQFVESSDEFKALTPQQKQTVRARYEKNPNRLLRRAAQDDPAQGITKGDVLFDPTDLLDDLRFLAASAPKAVPSQAQARNAALNADQQVKGNQIPPTVRNRPPVGQQPRTKDGKFKTTRDKTYRDYVMSDDDEDAA